MSVPLSIGFGRRFNVGDAWTAYNILEDVSLQGIEVDKSMTKEFADQIYLLNRRRFKDFRLNAINRKTKLGEFIVANDVFDFNPHSSALFNDSFDYDAWINRYRGLRSEIGVKPGIIAYSSIQNGERESTNSFNLIPFANIQYHLPINFKWQFDTQFNYQFTAVPFDVLQGNTQSFNWNNNLTYYLGRRINLVMNAGLSYFDANLGIQDITRTTIFGGTSLNYYISPACVMSAQFFVRKVTEDQFNGLESFYTQTFNYSFVYRII